ncbi:MAG TPA: holo-ACP synthase [Candidatus Bathyarchaeia archaeon]|nr:holo-ACP synthase [Candidatus Bathyarchaeia archaeon]
MIIGIGIDTVSISRIERLIDQRGEKFLRKVFSRSEIEEGMRRAKSASFFAARFAAREAFVKALGTGFRRGISVRDVEVLKGDLGRPELSFTKQVEDVLGARGIARCHLSLSHDGDNAQAVVILEGV